MSEVRTGMLLVATPELLDPNFTETVVLLLDVDEGGALGVVLNRPSPVAVAEVLAGWGRVVAEPEVLFRGGPVSTDGALAVGLLRTAEDVPGRASARSFGRLGLVDLDTPVELVDGSLEGMRIFAGYAGWGAGQLEDEVDEGSWYVVPAQLPDVFRVDPGRPLARRAAPPARRARLALHATRRPRPATATRRRFHRTRRRSRRASTD